MEEGNAVTFLGAESGHSIWASVSVWFSGQAWEKPDDEATGWEVCLGRVEGGGATEGRRFALDVAMMGDESDQG